jgi:flavin-dependent dehydrogenase
MTADVVVIGGGPAGTATALTLRRYSDLRVVVLERSDYSEQRFGETVGPGLQALLTFLGLWERFSMAEHLRSHSTAAAWGGDQLIQQEFFFTGLGEGWHLDRGRFDRMMAEAVREVGGEVVERISIQSISRDRRNDWQIAARSADGKIFAIKTTYVVDATGRSALVARQNGARVRAIDNLVGVIGFFTDAQGLKEEHAALIEACAYGWWYSVTIPDGRTVVALMSDADLVRKLRTHDLSAWCTLLSGARHTRSRVVDKGAPVKLFFRSANSRLTTPAGDGGWLAVGDAAAAFDPLSSMGIGHALSSGSHAARVVYDILRNNGEFLPQYLEAVIRNFRGFLELRSRFYSLERRWLGRPFWQRRHIPVDPFGAYTLREHAA